MRVRWTASGPTIYGYVGNDPVAHIDPLGLITDCEMNALRTLVNEYGEYRHVDSTNFNIDPDMVGHLGETSIFTNNSLIGTNPNGFDGQMQYSGSVIKKGDYKIYDLLDTAFHENAHQAQNPFSQTYDNLKERITGGESSNAENTARSIMDAHQKLVDEFKKLASDCNCSR